MCKKYRKRKIYLPVDLKDAGMVVPPCIVSSTLFLCIFFDGFIGPCFIILPQKRVTISKEITDMFIGNFKVKLFYYIYLYLI
jgi:hypothetical protein